MYIFLIVLLFPIINDWSFYYQYIMTRRNLSTLRFSIENDRKNYYSIYNEFIKNYDLFRRQLKRSIRKSKMNFLTHDQEIICLNQKIDVFFDVTSKFIIKNEKSLTPTHVNKIENFLKLLENSLFSSPKLINILHIQELFNKFNNDIKNLDINQFQITRKNVEEYYKDSRVKNYTSIIRYNFSNKIFEISILLITVIIDHYTDIIKFLTKTVYNYLF